MNLIETKNFLDNIGFYYSHFSDDTINTYLSSLAEEIDKTYEWSGDKSHYFRLKLLNRFNFNKIYYKRTGLPFAYTYKGSIENITLETIIETFNMINFDYDGLDEDIILKYMNLIIHQIRIDFLSGIDYDVDIKYYHDLIERDLNDIDDNIEEDYKEIYRALVLLGFDYTNYSIDYINYLFKEDLELFIKGISDGIPSNTLIYRMRKHMWDKSEAHIHTIDPHRHGRDASTNTSDEVIELNDDSEDSIGRYLGVTNGYTNRYDRQWMEDNWSTDMSLGAGKYLGPGPLANTDYMELPNKQYTKIYNVLNAFNHDEIKAQITDPIIRKDASFPNNYVFAGTNSNINLTTLIRDSNRYFYSEGLYRNTETLNSSTHVSKINALLSQKVSYPIIDTDTYHKINHSNPIIKIHDSSHTRYLGTEKNVDEIGYPRELVNSDNTQNVSTEPYNSTYLDTTANKNHTSLDVEPDRSSGPIPKIRIKNSHGTFYQSRNINVFDVTVNVQVSSYINTANIFNWNANVGDALPIPPDYHVNASIELLDINVQPSRNGNIVTGIYSTDIGNMLSGSSGIVQSNTEQKIKGFWSPVIDANSWNVSARIWFPTGGLVGVTGLYSFENKSKGSVNSALEKTHTRNLAHETEDLLLLGNAGHSSDTSGSHRVHRTAKAKYSAATLFGFTSTTVESL